MTFILSHLTPVLELVTAILFFLSTMSASKDKKEAIRTNTYSVINSHINSVDNSGSINVTQNIDNSTKERDDRWKQQSNQLNTIYISISIFLLLLCLFGFLYNPIDSTFSVSITTIYNALRTYILLLTTINIFNLFLFF